MLPLHLQNGRRDSFRSYVAAFQDEGCSVRDSDGPPDFTLNKGEIISSRCDDVLFYPPFEENLFGKVCCTNFRICFIPLTQQCDPCCSRNLILPDDFHVPLCSIAAIYYSSSPIFGRTVSSTKKFKAMSAPASQLDIISCIKICTKDFRILVFDLQRSQFAVNLANNIYHFSRPSSFSNFFEFSWLENENLDSIPFNNRRDWLAELDRCQVNRNYWRTCSLCKDSLNKQSAVPSYPFFVVVPSDLYDVLIFDSLIPNWNNGRFPVWCWSTRNGNSLLRSSMCNKDLNSQNLWEKMIVQISHSHPRSRRPRLIDCQIKTSEITSSFEKMRELCSIDSKARLIEREKDWYTSLDETGWCTLVFKCLKLARKAIHAIVNNQRSVIIADEDGWNVSAVISSLVQICADHHFRTIVGLNSLIEKDWFALGHPFGTNNFGCSLSANLSQSRQCTATFLLFLDAVSQLIRMHPLSFEYSQYMLIALWDLSITGIAPSFTCNSVSDRIALGKTSSPFPLSKYYSLKYCSLFTNVFYTANLLLAIDPSSFEIIRPSSSAIDVEFWDKCYLRWIKPLNIIDGGSISMDVSVSTVLSSAASVAYPNCAAVTWRQRLHPASEAAKISSAFPYSQVPSENSPVFEVDPSISLQRMKFEEDQEMKAESPERLASASLITRFNKPDDESRFRRIPFRRDKHRHSPPGTLV